MSTNLLFSNVEFISVNYKADKFILKYISICVKYDLSYT